MRGPAFDCWVEGDVPTPVDGRGDPPVVGPPVDGRVDPPVEGRVDAVFPLL